MGKGNALIGTALICGAGVVAAGLLYIASFPLALAGHPELLCTMTELFVGVGKVLTSAPGLLGAFVDQVIYPLTQDYNWAKMGAVCGAFLAASHFFGKAAGAKKSEPFFPAISQKDWVDIVVVP